MFGEFQFPFFVREILLVYRKITVIVYTRGMTKLFSKKSMVIVKKYGRLFLRNQGRAAEQIFKIGSDISGLKIFQDRIGSDPSLKKCDRIGSEARFEKSRSDRFGHARIFTLFEYILKIKLINSALT
jgi:hypothetical protein